MKKGFSLLELAIVLLIIGTVIGGSLVVGINRAETAQVELTKNRMDKIMDAIAVYMNNTGYLPCPADPALALSNTSATTSDTTGGACNNVRQTACASSCLGAAQFRVGAIPTATLAIPDEYMFDAWGRKFTYAIGGDQAAPIAGAGLNLLYMQGGTNPMPKGIITIYGPSASAITSTAMLVLISHGPTGHGAWPKGGGAARINAGLDAASLEQENADTPASGMSFNGTFRQTARSNDFGHIVQYYTRPDLIRYARGVIDSRLCEQVMHTLSSLSTSTAPKDGPVGCAVDNAAGSYNPECLVRERQLAMMLIPSQLSLTIDANISTRLFAWCTGLKP